MTLYSFRCLDQFDVLQVMDELKNNVEQEHNYKEGCKSNCCLHFNKLFLVF